MQLFVQLKNLQAGDHAALAPVNSDVQASQIPASYIEDTAEVAAAKEIFNEAFEEAKSGGLAAKQVNPVATRSECTYKHIKIFVNNLIFH